MSAAMVPFAPQVYFDLSGLPAGGGYVWVYQRGTTTPASGSVWYNLDGTTAGANPVPLDASGRPATTGAYYLSPGAYTLYLYGSDDVQIGPPVDIQAGDSLWGGGEVVPTGTAIIVKTYAGVRALVKEWDAVYVCGRAGDGDGGEGWFQRDPSETGADDDGVCLAAGGTRYVRIMDGGIDPRWFGVSYGESTDQTSGINAAATASARWNAPVVLRGEVTLLQSVTIPSGASVVAEVGGAFTGGATAVTVTFAAGSGFRGAPLCFLTSVTPKFALGVVPAAPLSWFGASTVEARLTKWASCAHSSSTLQVLTIDESVTTTTVPTIAAPYTVRAGGGVVTINAAVNLSVAISEPGWGKLFAYALVGYVGTVSVGPVCRPEWFGAVGDGSTSDHIPLLAAIKTGNVELQAGKRYSVGVAITTSTACTFSGPLSVPTSTTRITSASLVPSPCIVLQTGGAATMWTTTADLLFRGVGLALSDLAAMDATGRTLAFDRSVVYAAAGKITCATLQATDSIVSALRNSSAFVYATAILSNVRDDTLVGGSPDASTRHFGPSTAFRSVYLVDENGSSSYDKVVTAGPDGLLDSKTTLKLQSLSTEATTFSTTSITFYWYGVGAATHCRIQRDGVTVYDDITSSASYAVQTTDKAYIEVSATADGGASVGTCTIKPSAVPSGSSVLTIANKSPAIPINVYDSATCWGDEPLILPMIFVPGRMATVGFYVSGKWSFT